MDTKEPAPRGDGEDVKPEPGDKTAGEGKANFLSVLRHGGFRNLWLGQVVSQIGDYFAFLALMVVVSGFSDVPGNTMRDVSGMMIALTLPRLFFGLLAGVFVDRWDRKRTMLVSDLVRMVITLAMIPAVLAHNLWLIYALAFALSAVGTLFNPAKGALIPQLVPKEQLTSANALSQTSHMLATFIGPALAGVTFAAAGEGNQWVPFVVDSASFLVSALAIWSISVPTGSMIARNTEVETGNFVSALGRVRDELLVGLKALLLNRTMVALAGVVAVTWLGIGAINVLWVVFLKTGFGFEQTELAWRLSIIDIVFAAGMVLGSVMVGNFLSHITPKWFAAVGLLGVGIGIAPLGYLPDYWVVVASMLVIGAFVAPINTGTTTLMQIVVPNNQLGRVGGGIGTIADVASLISMGLAGVFGTLVGVPLVFLIGGIMCALGGIAAWVLLPPLTLKDKPGEVVDKAAGVQAESSGLLTSSN